MGLESNDKQKDGTHVEKDINDEQSELIKKDSHEPISLVASSSTTENLVEKESNKDVVGDQEDAQPIISNSSVKFQSENMVTEQTENQNFIPMALEKETSNKESTFPINKPVNESNKGNKENDN